ncbi:non-ribosomal peptide synthetase [Dictyobacter alpinus]|uniref:Non-ribosomal peptide synthetase n=1 Tax=Dictyobacter alpinus TaxID=2014873 RepID=A0A402BIV4_9CHLR|nr:non-ribosomal peptide synthetase [Dictyobacter alpinus]GCE31295.1 non-ribosomal peptide synthetase [Dictyobacter alpinus]
MRESLSQSMPPELNISDQAVAKEMFMLPASFAQKRLWFLEQWEAGIYHIPTAVGMKGQMNVEAMQWSIQEIIHRHEILRTTFQMIDGDIMQMVAPQIPFEMSVVDLRAFAPDVRNVKERRLVAETFHHPFDLSRGPLLRVSLLRLKDDSYSLLLTMHHIISDAWSMEVFVRELTTLYADYVAQRTSSLEELSIQYADYAIWQNDWLQGEVLDEHLTYWKEQLAHVPILQLPTDRPRPAIQSFRGAVRIVMFPKELTTSLKNVCRKEGVTMFMLLLAAFNALLYRYSGQDDIVVGIPIAGRTDSKVENLIGCFINTLALRTDLSGNPAFKTLLERVREVALSGYSHQDLPFERLVEELQPDRDLSYNALTQVMFAFQNVPRGEVKLPGLTLSPLKLDSETSKLKNADAERMSRKQNASGHGKKNAIFDLDLTMWENGETLFGEIKYNTDLFDTQTIIRLYEHFQTFLEAIATNITCPINDIPLLTAADLQRQLIDWNDTQEDNPLDTGFTTLFEQQVERTPDAIAVVEGEQTRTYRELNQQANRLAHALREVGVGPECLVALHMERSIALLTAILAVFKAGGAYLPLDLHHPGSRVKHLLQQSGAQLVLATRDSLATSEHELELCCREAGVRLDYIEELELGQRDSDNLPHTGAATDLAYVIYTSGSTGLPKGAMIEQRGMINHLYAKIHALDLQEDDCIAQTASQCFDISVWQFLAALLVGGTTYIYPNDITHDPIELLRAVDTDGCSILEIVPSLLTVLLDAHESDDGQQTRPALTELRWLIPTGEALVGSLCRRWFHLYPDIPLLNAYGPTECSDDVAHYEITAAPEESLTNMPIGFPVDNTQLYILDKHLQPVPIGVKGEIYVGGVGVGRGYLNDPERTAAAFQHDPFQTEKDARLYKTGDEARYLPDGKLEYLGRIDQQVKIRGFRVEPGEIEAVLERHPAVRSSLVIARPDAAGQQQLVAYCVPVEDLHIETSMLRTFCKEYLPDYIVPTAIIMLAAFPLTDNGKVDRTALPAPDALVGEQEQDYVAPRNALEQTLTEIWSEVLGVKRVGIHHDFFALGGHSLLTVRLVTQIQKRCGQRIPLAAIFQYRSIAELGKVLQTAPDATSWTAQEQGDLSPADLRAEAMLDLQTCPEVWPSKLELEPENILLTGATGFLGNFLLADLLEQTSATIYCLIRVRDPEEGKEKLQALLEAIGHWQPAYAERVVPLVGDLALTHLGLDDLTYQKLTTELGAIYHNGALVNSFYPYQQLRAANVEGTKEIIYLASHGRLKPLHYISTLSVFSRKATLQQPVIREQEALDEHGDFMKGGYAQSKWVAEKLVTVARSRGLPVVIYRPGRITGDSQSGSWRTNDVLCRVIKGCIQMGSVPDSIKDDLIEMTPVNYVSRAIVALARRKASFGQVYHLLNTAPARVEQVVRWLNDYGYAVQFLDDQRWDQEAKRLAEQDPDNEMIPVMPLVFSPKPAHSQPKVAPAQPLRFDNRNVTLGLSGTSITCPELDVRLFYTYLDRLVAQGFLAAPQQ